jgi:two-component system sensor kinase FixL
MSDTKATSATARLRQQIVERERAENALRESEARARAILDTTVDGIVTIDELGLVESFNHAAERLFGYAAAEVIGRNIKMLMPTPYDDEHDDYLTAYRRSGLKKIIGIGREVMGLRKDGTIFPMDLAVSETQLSSRRIFTGTVRDISARKEAEKQLRELAAIVESSDDAIISETPDGTIVSWNAGAEKMYGYSADEVRGRSIAIIVPPDRQDEMPRFLDRIHRGEAINRYETVRVRKGGKTIAVSVTISPIKDAHGTVIGASAIARDISERKRSEAMMQELQKQARQRDRLADIGAITAQIVHDLGNPLAGVSMQAQLILRRAQRDGQQPLSSILKPAERIVAEVHRLDGLVKEFMEFSREQRLDLKPVNLSRFLGVVIEMWQPLASARAIALTLEVPDVVPPVTADEEKLHRVFENLVKNAIEAIDHGPGRIRIVVTPLDDERVRISVADTGPGIPETVEAFRLFETTKPQGSGLGLPIVRQIVIAHGGGIGFAPAEPQGTIFHVELRVRGPFT